MEPWALQAVCAIGTPCSSGSSPCTLQLVGSQLVCAAIVLALHRCASRARKVVFFFFLILGNKIFLLKNHSCQVGSGFSLRGRAEFWLCLSGETKMCLRPEYSHVPSWYPDCLQDKFLLLLTARMTVTVGTKERRGSLRNV